MPFDMALYVIYHFPPDCQESIDIEIKLGDRNVSAGVLIRQRARGVEVTNLP
jgi:hypothetical protein